MAGFTFACALISSVSRDGDVAECGKALCVKPCNLFFNAAVGVGNNNGRIFFSRIIACRCINIGGNFQSVQFVAYGVDIYLPFYVLGNGIFINKPPGLLFTGSAAKAAPALNAIMRPAVSKVLRNFMVVLPFFLYIYIRLVISKHYLKLPVRCCRCRCLRFRSAHQRLPVTAPV